MKEFIINQIKDHTYIALAAHVSPDGDAIGACTALALTLYKMNKKPIILMDEFPDKYKFLPGNDFIHKEYPNNIPLDLFIALDCGDMERLGEYTSYFEKAPVSINIDHHISNPKYGDYYLVDSDASSTCEIIFDIINECNVPFDKHICTALYTGIAFDTGGFKHSSTTSHTHRVISKLLQYDIEFTDIMDRLFFFRSLQATKLLGMALNDIEVIENNQLCIGTLSKKQIDSVNASIYDTEGIIGFMKNIEGTKAAAFLYEKGNNEVKISFRSSGNMDVCKVAQAFNGGGHKKAAGCTLNMPLQKAKEEVLKIMLKELF